MRASGLLFHVKHDLARRQDFAYFRQMIPDLSVFPIAPSSAFSMDDAALGVHLLRSRGLKVMHDPASRAHFPAYLNGSDEQRRTELESAFNSGADLMWMARGGYGLTRLLPSLQLPSTKTPLLVGFSDTTGLHCHLWRHKGQKGIHASNLTGIAQEDADSLGILWAIFSGKAREIHWPKLRKTWWTPQSHVQGPLIVANLCVLTHLVGTPSMPDLNGTILVLEEIGERPYRIDRMLTQLRNSGSLKGVRAIVMGQFTKCEDASNNSVTPRSVLLERCQSFGIPLCEGLPAGHEKPNWALPFGALARISPHDDTLELRILEEIW